MASVGRFSGQPADATMLWSSFFDTRDADLATDSAVFALSASDATKRILVDAGNEHREIAGKLSNASMMVGQHTCFQGTASAGYIENFDNCGTLNFQWARQRLTVGAVTNTVVDAWCFGLVTINKGDSGGPVYDADYPTVKIRGIVSYEKFYTSDILPGIRPGPNSTRSSEPTPYKSNACFTTIEDFERASGWRLHY